MRYCTKGKKDVSSVENQSASVALMNVRGMWRGNNVEWEVGYDAGPNVDTTLTADEVNALMKHHQSNNVNLQRASLVKKMMNEGKSQVQIVRALGGKRGFGERQVKKDTAALSRAKKRGAMH